MTPVSIVNQPYQFVGIHQSLTVASSTPVPIPAGCNAMLMQATGQNVRVRFDGIAPTAGTGFQLQPSMGAYLLPLLIPPGGQPSILAIQEASGATLEVQGVIQAFP